MPVEKTSCLEKDPAETVAESSGSLSKKTAPSSGQMRRFVWALVILALCFSAPLYHLARFAIASDLYSYILLMPAVSWYLIHLKKNDLPPESKPLTGLGIFFLAAGTTMLAWYFYARHFTQMEDKLALSISALFLFCLGVGAITLGKKTFQASAFPLGMLIFMVPMPISMMEGIESFLQYGSATVAYWMFKLAGTSVVLTNLTFRLPGGYLVVAPECSGIHSSLILLITSLMAGYLFLRSPWGRTVLTLAVVPLALLRNGFRVFTIGELCVHIDWTMIDSYIHRHGGPIFFVLSLIPFFGLLAYLYRLEGSRDKKFPTKG
jgi:exosortase C (VPDSG-CTERM-specific)